MMVMLFLTVLAFVLTWVRLTTMKLRFDHVVGLGAPTAHPGVPLVACAKVGLSFRPLVLIIPSHVADDFLVKSIRIGRDEKFLFNDQLVSVGGLPAVMFTEGVDRPIALNVGVARVGDMVAVEVVNHSGEDRVFHGALVGEVVRPWWGFLSRRRVPETVPETWLTGGATIEDKDLDDLVEKEGL